MKIIVLWLASGVGSHLFHTHLLPMYSELLIFTLPTSQYILSFTAKPPSYLKETSPKEVRILNNSYILSRATCEGSSQIQWR